MDRIVTVPTFPGQAIPADGVFIKGQDVKVDESAVTGETDVMKKRMDTDPFLISGTNILEGLVSQCKRRGGANEGGL